MAKTKSTPLVVTSRTFPTVQACRRITSTENIAQSSRGNAIVEFSLLMPWMLFLFVGILDAGFYSYGIIATENAARVGALQASISSAASTNSLTACLVVLNEMNSLPNTAGVTSCGSGAVTATMPVSVVASSVDHGGGDVATRVTVMYQSLTLIPIPGLLPKQMVVTRSAEARIAS
ncbi:MAG: TadE/TadG family type IV pilus assembly protein [Bryobacteraceae bacterium]